MNMVPWRHIFRARPGGAPQRSRAIPLTQFQHEFFQPGLPLLIRTNRLPVPLRRALMRPETSDDLSPDFPKFTDWIEHDDNHNEFIPDQLSDFFLEKMSTPSPRLVTYEVGVSPKDLHSLEIFDRWLAKISQKDVPPWRAHADFTRALMQRILSKPHNPTQRTVLHEAPINLLAQALHYNQTLGMALCKPVSMYIAQAPLSDLPTSLQEAFPVPELVQQAGKGDVYTSTWWMGLERTNTPWHRDPNPNLLTQLVSHKMVRLMSPEQGEQLFRDVQARLGNASSSSRIRGMELLNGAEADALDSAVWYADGEGPPGMLQTCLGPSDSLFIPKGWWHSVRSLSETYQSLGRLNASVNFWFR